MLGSVRVRRLRLAGRLALLSAAVMLVAGCEGGGAKLGPRIVELGQPVPKGGGVYKVGAPYRQNGRLYTPSEVRRYDETGVASWYGELFHGRRTANGEIYDMEALSAAHPTLPLPSYVRVTNLRNGRSMVVRVNDRGPYVGGRVIDLSWAVASLLEMKGSGTAPVRVQYLGPAPLNGGERYEREVLAAQRWAGPHVAFAASPAKAFRQAASLGAARNTAALPASFVTAAAEPRMDVVIPARDRGAIRPDTIPASFIVAQTTPKYAPAPSGPPPSRPLPREVAKPAAALRGAPAAPSLPLARSQPQQAAQPDIAIRPAAAPASPGRTPALSSSAPRTAPPAPRAAMPSAPKKPAAAAPIYVEAGLFSRKDTADQLASILGEIAPATVEPLIIGQRSVHRLRVGPFPHDEAARAAIARMRDAGLTDARIEKPQG
ncbi:MULTISPECIES: septal ring lytic transglycosylase RlpA family protein [Rhodomicrobium]|uniref:septal ring lytic transglycosylase RlpA family protein n=1 Tax=Rhodomicrobium TaxID=1068 RepID=UPI000B4C1BE4|nr:MULTISPECIES: septal ring lytic transglycosylase RlpA family protein [Rhodomicrobium]